jgi:biopolymer transport protein ExbD
VPPDATEPVIGIVNGRGWTAVPFAQLGESLSSAAARNNPALTAAEIDTGALICVRPDIIISYGDVLRVMTAIRDHGFRRVALYSEAVVPVDDQGRYLRP